MEEGRVGGLSGGLHDRTFNLYEYRAGKHMECLNMFWSKVTPNDDALPKALAAQEAPGLRAQFARGLRSPLTATLLPVAALPDGMYFGHPSSLNFTLLINPHELLLAGCCILGRLFQNRDVKCSNKRIRYCALA